jgi:hypothetical protein
VAVVKALTLTQPWASLVVAGTKRYETRGWRPPTFGRIAIHAAKAFPDDAIDFAIELQVDGVLPVAEGHSPWALQPLPRGAVIGEVTVVRIITTESGGARALSALERQLGDYTPGRYAWELVDPVVYDEPIPARGMLGLWEWERPA